MLSKEELRQRGWEQPPIPDDTEHNPREFYESEEYLSWYNGMEARGRHLHSPKMVEKRIAGLKRKGHFPSQFGLLTASGTHMQDDTTLSLRNDHSLTPTQRKIIGKQLRTQEEVLGYLRSLVSEEDVVRIYDTLTEQAIATGDSKLLEVWLKYLVGMPAQQINVTKTDVSKVLEIYAAQMDEERAQEYVVVDAETSGS